MTDTLVPEGPCWVWQGVLTEDGYGRVWTTENRGELAHRMAYLTYRGPIPEYLTVDHLCRNRACVNPWHLELVTKGENSRRGLKGFALTGRCRSGKHAILSEDDIYDPPSGSGRGCRHCRNERNRRYRRSTKVD